MGSDGVSGRRRDPLPLLSLLWVSVFAVADPNDDVAATIKGARSRKCAPCRVGAE